LGSTSIRVHGEVGMHTDDPVPPKCVSYIEVACGICLD
jgi:hypothetical protein